MILPTLEAVCEHEAKGGLWRPIPAPRVIRGVLRQPHTASMRLVVGVDDGRVCVIGPGGATLKDIVSDGNNAFLQGARWVPVEV
jgi:hypothetical protein